MATDDKTRGRRSSQPGSSTARSTASTVRSTNLARRDTQRDYPTWRDPWTGSSISPMGHLRSWTDQMERFFNSFGLGTAGNRIGDWDLFNPQIESFQRGNELVIRADLPGLSKDDVNVEVTEDAVVIQGERRDEFEDSREGVYRSERSYGSFYRAIPLPAGAISEDAKATFRNGVLEVTMPAPPQEANRGRKIEITEGATSSESPSGGSRMSTTNRPNE